MKLRILFGSESAPSDEGRPVGWIVIEPDQAQTVLEIIDKSAGPVRRHGPSVDSLFHAIADLRDDEVPLGDMSLVRYPRLGLDTLRFRGKSGVEFYPLEPAPRGIASRPYRCEEFLDVLQPIVKTRQRALAHTRELYANFERDLVTSLEPDISLGEERPRGNGRTL